MPRLAGQTGQTVQLPSLHVPKGPTSAVEATIRPGRRLPVGLRPPALKVWPHAHSGSQSARGVQRSETGRPPGLEMPMSARAGESSSSFPAMPWDEISNTDPKYSTGTSWPPALKASLGDWKDVAPSQLSQADLRRSAYLKGRLEQMRLPEFFDEQGGPHFHRLGLGFVAKHQTEIGSAFGSRGDLHSHTNAGRGALDAEPGMIGNARSYLAAIEAVAKDTILVQQRAKIYQSQVKGSDRTKEGDVEKTRVGHLFTEVPDFEIHVPKPVILKDLIPSDLGEHRELEERNIVDRQLGHLTDIYWIEGAQMGWLFTQPEVSELSTSLDRWAASTRGVNLPMGMCRSTFCRFLLDTKLADQNSVPYFWAVQLFDSVAQPARVCAPNAQHASTAPICLMVSRWRLISVLDAIIRQHSEAINRYDVLVRIKDKMKELFQKDLPDTANLVQEPLSDEDLSPMSGDDLDQRRQTVNETSTRPCETSIEIDSACRERLLQAMLIEPEVLHLVFLYQEIFRLLYDCYAKDDQHMEFPELLRFCVDFYLVPQFATEESLKGLYEGALCLEKRPEPDIPQSVSMDRTSLTIFKKKASVLGRMSIAMRPSGKKASVKLKTIKKQSSSSALSRSSSMTSQSSKSKAVAETDSDAFNRSTSLSEDTRVSEPAFRLAAFIETIVKLSFLHAGFYGNAVQLCSSSYFKVTWLLTYLRWVMEHMHSCQDKLALAGESPDEQVAAVRALQAVPLDLWDRPPILPTDLDLPVVLQPLPGPGSRKLPRRRLRVQASAPRLRPSKGAEDQSTEAWRQKRRKSMEEAMMFQSARKTAEAPVVKKSETKKRDTLKSKVADDSSSGGEEEYLGSLPSLDQANRTSKISEIASLRSNSTQRKSLTQLGKGTEQARASVVAEDQSDVMEPQEGLLPLEDLFPAESGKPCFENGQCQLCGRVIFCEEDAKSVRDAKIQSSGNPHCRGCSVVDALSFQRHPFSRLLLGADSGVKMAKLKAKPHVGKRMHPTFPLPPESGTAFGTQALQILKKKHAMDV